MTYSSFIQDRSNLHCEIAKCQKMLALKKEDFSSGDEAYNATQKYYAERLSQLYGELSKLERDYFGNWNDEILEVRRRRQNASESERSE